jgi:chromosome segregation ATPase
MARTGIAAQLDGWQHQTDHLTVIHTERAYEPEWTCPELAEIKQQAVQDAGPARQPSRTLQMLAAQLAAFKKRVAELEDELDSAREEFALRENETSSVQTSYNLIAAENAHLSRRLAEGEAAADKACSEVEYKTTALALAELECTKLASAAAEASEQHRTETCTLQTGLEAMSSRALAAESMLTKAQQRLLAAEGMLAKTQQRLLARTETDSALHSEISRLFDHATKRDADAETARSQLDQAKTALAIAERERDKLAIDLDGANNEHRIEISALNARLEAMTSRTLAAEQMLAEARKSLLEKLELLQDSLRGKERQLRELEQSNAKLIAGTSAVLNTLSMRDAATARNEERIRSLVRRVVELEAEVRLSKNRKNVEGPARARPVATLRATTITL